MSFVILGPIHTTQFRYGSHWIRLEEISDGRNIRKESVLHHIRKCEHRYVSESYVGYGTKLTGAAFMFLIN